MKNKTPQSKLTMAAQITGAATAIGLLCFQLFVSKEEINTTPWLHTIQISLVSLAAIAAIALVAGVAKDKKKASKK